MELVCQETNVYPPTKQSTKKVFAFSLFKDEHQLMELTTVYYNYVESPIT